MKTSFPLFALPLLLFIVTLSGSGCRATRQVVNLSRPHIEAVPHRVQAIHGAYVTEDGRLLLHATGILAGGTQANSLTVTLLRSDPSSGRLAERFVISPAAVQPGWAPGRVLQPIRVGPRIEFKANETYEWHRLGPFDHEVETVHLVHRLNRGGSWEILRVCPRQTERFIVYEVQSARVIVSRPSYAFLLPVAAAVDATAIGAMTAGPIAIVGAGLAATPYLGSTGIQAAGQASTEMVKKYEQP